MSEVISILEENEIDVFVMCSCGIRFYMYVTDAQYECSCGKLYTAHIHILEQGKRRDDWTIAVTPIADPYDYDKSGDEDAEEAE